MGTLTLVLALGGLAEPACASIGVKHTSMMLSNTGSYATIEVNVEEESDVRAYGDTGVQIYWKRSDDKDNLWALTVAGDKKSVVGANTVSLIGETSKEMVHLNVFVYDNIKPEITDIKFKNKKLYAEWEALGSPYFNIEYKAKGERWKTFSKAYKGTSISIGGIKAGRQYSFRIRPVTYSQEWGIQYGEWSKAQVGKSAKAKKVVKKETL